jgi:divalent metal cation (Fe/Co/Zn/Cd) transporter
MDGNIHLSRAHANTELIERAVQKVVAGADVTVHVEPTEEKKKR